MTTPMLQGNAKHQYPLSGLRLYNDYLMARIVYLLNDMGFFDYLQTPNFSVAETAAALKVPEKTLTLYFSFLTDWNVLTRDEERYSFEPETLELLKRDMGFLIWLIGGYEPLLSNANALVRNELKYGKDIQRVDPEMALGTAAVCKTYTDHIVWDFFERNRIDIHMIADIGCASGKRMIEICRRFPTINAIGVDMSEACCELSRSNVRAAGLSDRITIIQAKGEDWLLQQKDLQNGTDGQRPVDLLMSVGMFHDFINIEGMAENFLKCAREGLRSGAMLYIQDQMQLPSSPHDGPISWSRGFEIMHHLMGQDLFTIEHYQSLFDQAGLTTAEIIPTDIAEHHIFVLKV